MKKITWASSTRHNGTTIKMFKVSGGQGEDTVGGRVEGTESLQEEQLVNGNVGKGFTKELVFQICLKE